MRQRWGGWARALGVLACATGLLHGAEAQTAAVAPRPEPDVLIFVNGDQLTGTLERVVDGTVTFKSDVAGDVTVPLAKVKELRSTRNFALLRKGAPSRANLVGEGPVIVTPSGVTVQPAGKPETTVPDPEVGYLVNTTIYDKKVERGVQLLEGWSGAVNAGATLVRSTQTGTTFTGGASLVRTVPGVSYLPKQRRSTVTVSETYGNQRDYGQPVDSVIKTNIFHADAEHDHYLSTRRYFLINASFDHNFSQGLQLAQIYGAGFGATLIQSPVQTLDLTAEIHYEKQQFFMITPGVAEESDRNLIGGTLQENYRRTLPRKILFTETANYLPAFNEVSAYAANLATGLTLPLFQRFSANISVTDNYLNDPPEGARKNSFQFVTGVSYTLP